MKSNRGVTVILCLLLAAVISSHAQDGAGYDPAAANYRAASLSMAGGNDSPEMHAALGLIWADHTQQAIAAIQKLADKGDIKAALFLGGNLP